jgi:DNA transformation protein
MDAESIRELFSEFGPIDVRRMFGGAGVFVGGLMIALVSREVIHLKADAETIPEFEREGLGPFTYATRDGEHKLTSYWRMPERLYDDAEELAQWARRAHAVALRAAARKEKPKTARKPVRRPSQTKRKPPRGRSRT